MAEKILIVDDDLDTLRLVGMMLEREGYEIAAASSGEQALSLVKSIHPDLVLLDLMMPDIDGVDVARRLRSDPDTQDLLIVMFTAKSQMEDKLEGYDAGADDYITKPIQPRELIAHVKAVLKRAKRKAAASLEALETRGNIIGVLAAKGGVGVSTVALNLGVAIQDLYKKTVIVSDFRPGCGTIGLDLGYTNSQAVTRMLAKEADEINASMVAGALVQHSSGIQLLLSSPYPHDAIYLDRADNFDVIVKHLSALAHFVVLDLGISLTAVNDRVLKRCDQVIVVLEPVPQTVLQTKALLSDLMDKGLNEDHFSIVLMNRLRAGMQLSLGQVQDQLGAQVSVVFTAAPELAYQALVQNTPLILQQPDGVTTQQFIKLADHIAKRSIQT
jgi:pilus assembly protein CpaE